MQKICFFILFLCNPLWASPLAAETVQDIHQDSTEKQIRVVPLEFNQDKLESLRKNPSFDYTERSAEESLWTKIKQYISLQWKRMMQWLFGDLEASGFLLFLLKALPYLILIMALVLLVYLFTELNPAAAMLSSKKEDQMIFAKEEDIIRFEDIPSLIEQAVKNGDYRLAVRYHFLYLLQQFSRRGIITYDNTKTDEDYLNEIRKEELKPGFKRVSRIYDFIWYGQFETGEETYSRIAKEFRAMENSIGT